MEGIIRIGKSIDARADGYIDQLVGGVRAAGSIGVCVANGIHAYSGLGRNK